MIMIMMKRTRIRRGMVCGVERWVRAELPPPLSPQQSTIAARAEHYTQQPGQKAGGRAEHKQPRQIHHLVGFPNLPSGNLDRPRSLFYFIPQEPPQV